MLFLLLILFLERKAEHATMVFFEKHETVKVLISSEDVKKVHVAIGSYVLGEKYQISLAQNQKIRIEMLATEKQQFSIQLRKNSSIVALHIEFNRGENDHHQKNDLLTNYLMIEAQKDCWGTEKHHQLTDIAWSKPIYVIVWHQENSWMFVINGGQDTYSNDRSPFNANDVSYITIDSHNNANKPEIQRIDVQPFF